MDAATDAGPEASRWRPLVKPWLALMGVLLLAGAAYLRVLDGEFQYDDTHTVVRSLAIRDLGGAARSFAAGLAVSSDRALTRLSFAVDYAIGGLSPRPFHATGLALHGAAVVVIFLLGRRLAARAGVHGAEWVAALAAGLFALHPIQSGAVAYVSQRAEVLSSLLYATSLLLLLASEERWGHLRGRLAYAAALLAFVLALAAKPIAVTAPVAYAIAAFVLPSPAARSVGWGARRRLLLLTPWLAVGALYTFRTLATIDAPGAAPSAGSDAGFDVPGLPPLVYGLTQLRVVVAYLRLLLLPVGQNVDWDVSPSASLLDPPSTILSAAFLGALLAWAAWAWARLRSRSDDTAGAARLAVFGLLWFFLVLAPTSSVVPLSDVMMEHRLYLAGWGVFLGVAVLAERALALLHPAAREPAALAGALALALLLAGALHARNAVWETRLALWTDAMRKSPSKARPWAQVALAHQEAGRLDLAIPAYGEALRRFRPFESESEVQTRRNLSTALVSAGRPREAVAVLERASELSPGNPEIATNLGLALLQSGDVDGAERWIGAALASNPRLPEALALRGNILLRRGDPAAAEQAFAAAARLSPDVAAPEYNRGVALERMGRTREACAAWTSARSLQGDPALADRIARKLALVCR